MWEVIVFCHARKPVAVSVANSVGCVAYSVAVVIRASVVAPVVSFRKSRVIPRACGDRAAHLVSVVHEVVAINVVVGRMLYADAIPVARDVVFAYAVLVRRGAE